MSYRTRARSSFLQTQIYTDLRRFELEKGENRELARSRHVPIGAVGVLRFGRARMGENTAQGWESELQDARMVLILFSDADSQQI